MKQLRRQAGKATAEHPISIDVRFYAMQSCQRTARDMQVPLIHSLKGWTPEVTYEERIHNLAQDPFMQDLLTRTETLPASQNCLIIFVDGCNTGDRNYKKFKALCLEKGIVTQFINQKTQRKLARQRAMICSALAIQIMAKFGVAAWYSFPRCLAATASNILFIGIDVCHKSPTVCCSDFTLEMLTDAE